MWSANEPAYLLTADNALLELQNRKVWYNTYVQIRKFAI